MALVTCSQFKTSQEEQDNRMISAEDELLDKSSGVGGGKVTVEKIKEAIAGDVAVAVKEKSGIKGDGTKENPLQLDTGDGITIDPKTGKAKLDIDKAAELISTKANIRILDAFEQEDEIAYAFAEQGGK
ncbi:hypothetical protein [Mannheimia varigena]|uniref:hypothetical protein n=1 Tax=Mannheimia varigena TaxID=85404 RepID=UPI0015B51426|nr:hypothetical protein [Mannheimia varigena]QLD33174.1 hypothetical protein A6B42_05075 [Mannheimia varigena]